MCTAPPRAERRGRGCRPRIQEVRGVGNGCPSGGAQFVVEQLCLLREACNIKIVGVEFDPTDYACHTVSLAECVLAMTAEVRGA